MAINSFVQLIIIKQINVPLIGKFQFIIIITQFSFRMSHHNDLPQSELSSLDFLVEEEITQKLLLIFAKTNQNRTLV